MTMTSVEHLPSPIQAFRHEMAGMESQFSAALAKHIPVERFCRVVLTAVSQNPDLLKCTRRSLWNACMKAAQDSLLPDGREGAIVAYKDQAQWMPMVAGLRKKVRNSGEIATWECHVVYEHDEFDFALGDDPHIAHKPAMGEAGKPIAAYSIATLKSGERSREVMTVAEIEAVRSRSRAARNGPWVTDWSEMARKTVARRHSKVLPMSSDLDDLMRRDDDLYNFDAAKKETAESEHPRTLAGRLDRLALSSDKHDPETGEITTVRSAEDDTKVRTSVPVTPEQVVPTHPTEAQQEAPAAADGTDDTGASAEPWRGALIRGRTGGATPPTGVAQAAQPVAAASPRNARPAEPRDSAKGNDAK